MGFLDGLMANVLEIDIHSVEQEKSREWFSFAITNFTDKWIIESLFGDNVSI